MTTTQPVLQQAWSHGAIHHQRQWQAVLMQTQQKRSLKTMVRMMMAAVPYETAMNVASLPAAWYLAVSCHGVSSPLPFYVL